MILKFPIKQEELLKLKAGDLVYLSGEIYTARDTAHKKMICSLKNNEKLPIDLKNQCIYYVGPTPTKPGQVIGSAGPTTSMRMDEMSLTLLDEGLKIMIGKGNRDESVRKKIKEKKAIYLIAIGGVGALISKCILSSEIVAYEELATEAIRRLIVKDMPLIVGIDTNGEDIYKKMEGKNEL